MKDNKLIAEFMGAKIIGKEQQMAGKIDFPHRPFQSCPVNDLQYHSSWDWLMPVVEKCYDTPSNGDSIDNYMSKDSFCRNDIKAVYNAVVEFIKWYNEQDNHNG